MSIWTRITDALAALASGESLATVFETLRASPQRSVAFTIAVIALGAKMAKADGRVTRDEVAAFREVFTIAPQDEAAAARVFNLARQDAAGFEVYARKIGAMFWRDGAALSDLLEGLFHIAVADGAYHQAEDAYLAEVARIFGIPEPEFRSLRARFVPDNPHDPYDVLGVTPDMDLAAIRAAWRARVLETHPDRMLARGVPPEALKMAEARLIALNAAGERISRDRAA
jgi:DnaJ like chaperone protein